jgi:outer membrane murein-binding lipoprotein Lpp
MSVPDPNNGNQYNTLTYRVTALERDVTDLRAQIQTYVPQKENELQLSFIRAAVDRIEKDVSSVKTQVTGVDEKVTAQKESQDKLLIRILWGIVSTIIAIVVVVAGYYFTHLP